MYPSKKCDKEPSDCKIAVSMVDQTIHIMKERHLGWRIELENEGARGGIRGVGNLQSMKVEGNMVSVSV